MHLLWTALLALFLVIGCDDSGQANFAGHTDHDGSTTPPDRGREGGTAVGTGGAT